MTPPLIVLIGPPGAGKTTVGRQVAEALGVEFRDTDHDIEITTGRPIADIFVEDGEPTFRQLEREAVAAALASHDGVLALGGGAVLDASTQDLLRGHHVVFLDVGLADAAARVGLARDRPLLLGNPRSHMKRLLDERRPVYTASAVTTISTDGRRVDDVAADVLEACR